MGRKLCVILWKDLLMRRNHYVLSTLEILVPTLIFILQNYASSYISVLNNVQKSNDTINYEPVIQFDLRTKDECEVPEMPGIVLYEPSNEFVDKLMEKAACYARYPAKAVKPKTIHNNSDFKYWIKFEGLQNTTESLNYTIFLHHSIWAAMNYLRSGSEFGSIISYNHHTPASLLQLKVAIDQAFLHLKNFNLDQVVEIIEMNNINPQPNQFIVAMLVIALFFVFAFMIPVVISRIIKEKDTGAKELMLMMGVRRWHLWVSKLLDGLLFSLIISTIAVILFSVPLREDSFVFQVVSIFPVWLFLLYGFLAVLTFLFVFSCCFKNSTVAVYFTQIVCGLTFLIFTSLVIFDETQWSRSIRLIMCLCPQLAVISGIVIFLNFEYLGRPVSFTESLSGSGDCLSLLDVTIMLTGDIVIYSLLTWYLDHVRPGKYGIAQPVWFCFKKSYWTANKIDVRSPVGGSNSGLSVDIIEPVPSGLVPGVSVQNLTKKYKAFGKGSVTAVNNVSIHFYRGEISSLLGHNGAGKTTTFSMITGLTSPTSGRVLINGYDMATDSDEARKSLGLCPQHDMLFSELTAQQTLTFYAMVKGLSAKNAAFEADELFIKLRLTEVKNTQGTKLSGGQKRKLSLAIALIGGSEVLVLDEPTSGMDPEIRREIWEMLLALRDSKTILLTTHYMEEADVLSDRIAIMDHGVIQCHGTPMFLKSKFGTGYTLAVVISPDGQASEVTDFVQHHVPSAEFKSQNGMTLYYGLPEKDVTSFPPLLTGLENKKCDGEIRSYAVTVSTLEDVFLKVGDLQRGSKDEVDHSYKRFQNNEEMSPSKMPFYFLAFSQIYALFIKKGIYFLRTFILYISFCAVPIGFIVFFYCGVPRLIEEDDSHQLTLSLDLYRPAQVMYTTESGKKNNELEQVIRKIGSDPRLVTDIGSELGILRRENFPMYLNASSIAFSYFPSNITLWYNSEIVHAPPIGMDLIFNAILKSKEPSAFITTTLDNTYAVKNPYARDIPPDCLRSPAQDIINFCGFQTLYYLIGPIQEHYYNSKELQLMVTPTILYWLCHFIFDIVTYAFFLVTALTTFQYIQPDLFESDSAGDMYFAVMLWGIGMILLSYLISTIIKGLASGFSVALMLHVLCCYFIYYVLAAYTLVNELEKKKVEMNFESNLENKLTSTLSIPWQAYLHPNLIWKFGTAWTCNKSKVSYKLALALYDIILFVLLLLTDSKMLSIVLHRVLNCMTSVVYRIENQKDSDVDGEENEVKKVVDRNAMQSKILVADGLCRWYGARWFKTNPAVKGVSFAVDHGECFGLLGVNGAGKTSTFNMLTGSLPASEGRAYVNGFSLSSPWQRQKYLFQIGYCPQFSGILPMFHGRELLQLFARMRGVRYGQVDKEVRFWIDKLELNEHAEKQCGNYSGGNLRKLATGIALIGDSPLIFLDEPTSGVDPAARRSIWHSIHEVRNHGQSVVLTSHSMEECESLCTRLAIMVGGHFRCLGDTVTLKSKYGQGYSIQMKVSTTATQKERKMVKDAMLETFKPGCELTDEHFTIFQFRVTNKNIQWPEIFQKLEDLKKRFKDLESYSASATTLEEIFISFAKDQ